MNDQDWREDWLEEELAGEAALADPPEGAGGRVLAGVLTAVGVAAPIATSGAAAAATAASSAPVAAATAPAVAAAAAPAAVAGGALWVKGLALTAFVAAGAGIVAVKDSPAPATEVAAPQQQRAVASRPATPKRRVVAPLPKVMIPDVEEAVVNVPAQDMPSAVEVVRNEKPAEPAAREPAVEAKPPAPKPIAAKPTRRAPVAAKKRAVPPAPDVAPVVTPEPAPAVVAAVTPKRAPTAPIFDEPEPRRVRPVAPDIRDEQLRAERAYLATARRALGQEQAARAQAILAAYPQKFAARRMAEEHHMLQIRALLMAGKRSAALKSAKRFHAQYPRSVFRTSIDRMTVEKNARP